MINSWPLCPSLEQKTALPHGLTLSPWPSWPGLAGKLTLPLKKRSNPLFVSNVFKRQVSVRKCKKFWLAQGSWARPVTLLLGATFLDIGATLQFLEDLTLLARKNMNKQSLEPSPKTKELRHIGVYSELLQDYYLVPRAFPLKNGWGAPPIF